MEGMPQRPHQSAITTEIAIPEVESATTDIEVTVPSSNRSPLHAKIDKILHKVEHTEAQLGRLGSKGNPPSQEVISTRTAASTVNPAQQKIKEARSAKQLKFIGLIYNAEDNLCYCHKCLDPKEGLSASETNAVGIFAYNSDNGFKFTNEQQLPEEFRNVKKHLSFN